MNWLKFGDGNTKLFHSFASERKRSNNIKELLDGNGIGHTKVEEVADIFISYFQGLFSTFSPSIQEIDEIISQVVPVVVDDMNTSLCAPHTEKDIRKALFVYGSGARWFHNSVFPEILGSCWT